jgi:tRNA dimethylallyltransferase
VSRFPVIIGPTAGGKSDLAVDVADLLGGQEHAEIVTADAFQIYRGMDIGTAKPTPAERRGIPHHLIDIVEPTESFTVSDWLAAAEAAGRRHQVPRPHPILVGGTHLYIKAFIEGLFQGPDPDPHFAKSSEVSACQALRKELERVDPAAAARIHPNDERRTIRALEVFRQTGTPITQHQQQWDRASSRADCALIGLEWPVESLNPRINARVKGMMDRGLLEEVRTLHASGRFGAQAREALGYKQLIEHLEGRATLEEAVEQIKIETRRFAKNQRTWLRRLRTTPGSLWIDAAATETRGEWPAMIKQACGSDT